MMLANLLSGAAPTAVAPVAMGMPVVAGFVRLVGPKSLTQVAAGSNTMPGSWTTRGLGMRWRAKMSPHRVDEPSGSADHGG